MYEILQVNVLIEKILEKWLDYCNHLKHKEHDLTLQELIAHMKIEEVNHLKDKNISSINEFYIKANVVESFGGFKVDRSKVVVGTMCNVVEDPKRWIVDSGATKHFCSNRDIFSDFEPASGKEKVYMGNKSESEILGKGTINLKLSSRNVLKLQNFLYVPSMSKNLISSFVLDRDGIET